MGRIWPIAIAGAFVAGCALFTDLEGFDCGADGCVEAGAPDASDAPLADVAANDAGGDAGADAGGARCPEGRGAKMIVAGSFCIDSTETTNAQYAAFLADSSGAASSMQPAVCANAVDHIPGCFYDPAGRANQPVRCVSWCDAWLFCRWAGKRLCGKIGGGTLAPADSTNPALSEWMAACTLNGQRGYAYGTSPDPTACPGDNFDTHDVGAVASCQGGYPGLFDMNGNVEEWEDACQPGAAPGTVECQKRGNDYAGSNGACGQSFGENVFNDDNDTGIRCCAD